MNAPNTANKYPSAEEFFAMAHKAKAAHPNDSEQMFYATLRLACDWQREADAVVCEDHAALEGVHIAEMLRGLIK